MPESVPHFDLEKMDWKDRRILLELDKNGRQPFSQISKAVGLSKETVNYRIQRLETQGFLEGFYAFSNLPLLGFNFYKVYFRFRFAQPEQEKEIIQYLDSQRLVCWMVSCDGAYDLIINVVTNTLQQFDQFLSDFRAEFGQTILASDVTTITNILYLDRVYLTGQKQNLQEIQFPKSGISLDHTDALCLSFLSKDARMSLTEIGKQMNLSPEAVRKRIEKLVKTRVIQKFAMKLNYPLFNYQYYKVMIKFQNLTQTMKERFLKYCMAQPNIIVVVEGIGVSDVDLDIELPNPQSFHALILDLKSKFGPIVKDYQLLLISKELKASYLAPLKYLIE